MARVGLVGCVKSKLSHAAPAAELYTSPLFRGRRRHVEASCDQWFVLSAQYGLVRPESRIEPYDVTLKAASRAERRAWSRRVTMALLAELGTFEGVVFEVHAGNEYRAYGLFEALIGRGGRVEVPTEGLSIGRQLAFYGGIGRP